MDVITTVPENATVSVLLGQEPFGSFYPFGSPSFFPVGLSPSEIAIADFDGGGALDVAVVNRFSNNLSVLLGQGDGTFATHVIYGTESTPSGVAVGDVDGDGLLDLVTANESSPGSISYLAGIGDGTFQPAVEYALRHTALDVALADANGDGRLDVIVTGSDSGRVTVLLNPGRSLADVDPIGPRASLPTMLIRPNPVRSSADLQFHLPVASPARIEIFDVSGRRRMAIDLGQRASGWHRATWNREGARESPGVYFARLTTRGSVVTRRLVLLDR